MTEAAPADKKPRDNKSREGKREGPAGRGVKSGEVRQKGFERKSGTGRGKEVAKDGAGAHNWGKTKEGEEGAAEAPAAEGDAAATEAEAEVPAEPEVKTFTLDEFLAQKKAAAAANNELLLKTVAERAVEAPKDLKAVVRDTFDDIEHPDLRAKKAAAKAKEVSITSLFICVCVCFGNQSF